MGFSPISGNGKFVRIAILDSGMPLHTDITVDKYQVENFTKSGSSCDVYGHSTAIAGIIAANGKSGIRGFAPDSDLWFAKCLLDENGEGDFDNVTRAVFWSIVKEVDIIVMAFGSSGEHQGLRDAIKKANRMGISIFAAAGNCTTRTKDADYPARFDEVFSVGYAANISQNEAIMDGNNVKGLVLPNRDFDTTFTDSSFATMRGSSMCVAAIAGIASLVFHNLRRDKKDIKNPQVLYNEIGKLAVKS